MTAILYTTTDAIRASIGLSSKDLADAAITAARVEDQLSIELDDLLETHADVYTTGTAGGATAEEEKQAHLLSLFCQYQGALIVCTGLHMSAPQRISDGTMEMQRFSREDLNKTIARIKDRADSYRGRIEALSNASFEPLSLLAAVPPTRNPVTDEG